jgi:molybdopterin synthase catalytic subunit
MVVMRVVVLFFGRLKEIVGKSEERIEIPQGARVEDVFARFGREHPGLVQFRSSVVASVNEEFADWSAALNPGDEVAFLPPVSGGSGGGSGGRGSQDSGDIFELVRAVICTAPLIAHVKQARDGAVVTFDGIVRDHSGGRQTRYLEYEGYEPMALQKMRAIGEVMRARFAIDRIGMVHRLGRLEIGETSVFIAVSAAHRAVAFDACRFAIDTLKRSVPIWKKEYFADGAVWAEGEAAQPIPGPPASTME